MLNLRLLILFTLSLQSTQSIARWSVYETTDKASKRSELSKEDQIEALKQQSDRVGIIRQSHDCLYAHKVIRSIHGEHEFIWSEELAYSAEEWAIYLAADIGKIQHSSFTFLNGSRYGENLYELTSGEPARCNAAVSAWYNEIHGYDFSNPSTDSRHGHFTQLVWNESKQVGVGIAYNNKTRLTYIVARYTPPGNDMFSKYVKEVRKPQPGTHVPSQKELLPKNPDPIRIIKVGVQPKNETSSNTSRNKTCVDTVDCTFYVKQGDCETPIYKAYMDEACYKSCSGCKPGNPVDGGWTDWCDVFTCSRTCGGGHMHSYRYCSNPYPGYGGKYCDGESSKKTVCNTQACPPTSNVTSTADCKDSNDECIGYKKLGYCHAEIYAKWMLSNCKLSCGLC